MITKEYAIRLSREGEERERAVRYVSEHMFAAHNSCPPPDKTPEHLFIVLDQGEIVGSLAVEFGRPGNPLPFEEFFAFDPSMAEVPYVREQTIYYSRWNSSRKNLGPVIWLFASEYALSKGMLYSSATAKPAMFDHCRRTLGFRWRTVPGAVVKEDGVGEEERAYFFGDVRPRPCLGVLSEQAEALRSIVRNILEQEGIVILR